VVLSKLEIVTEELKVIREETILSCRSDSNRDNHCEEDFNRMLPLQDRNGIADVVQMIEQENIRKTLVSEPY